MTRKEISYPRRAAARERNRQALLAATAELARTQGYANTSLSEVAERACVTKGAIYSIFGGKSQLFLAALAEQIGIPYISPADAEPGDVPGYLALLGREWARDAAAPSARLNLEIALDTMAALLRDESATAAGRHMHDQSVERLAQAITEVAQRGGVALATPALDVARRTTAMLTGLTQVCLASGDTPSESDFADAARQLGRGATAHTQVPLTTSVPAGRSMSHRPH